MHVFLFCIQCCAHCFGVIYAVQDLSFSAARTKRQAQLFMKAFLLYILCCIYPPTTVFFTLSPTITGLLYFMHDYVLDVKGLKVCIAPCEPLLPQMSREARLFQQCLLAALRFPPISLESMCGWCMLWVTGAIDRLWFLFVSVNLSLRLLLSSLSSSRSVYEI